MLEKKSIKSGIIGVDTSFLIDFFKEEDNAVMFMKNNLYIIKVSELVIYEFLCGNLTESNQQKFFDAMQSFPSVSFNRQASIIASELYMNAKKQGKITGHQDCMIAGSYLA